MWVPRLQVATGSLMSKTPMCILLTIIKKIQSIILMINSIVTLSAAVKVGSYSLQRLCFRVHVEKLHELTHTINFQALKNKLPLVCFGCCFFPLLAGALAARGFARSIFLFLLLPLAYEQNVIS